MSRAINLALPEPEVVAACAKNAIRISAVETLLSGGTHLVCVTSDGANQARALFKRSIIEGAVRRSAFLRKNPSSYM